VHLSCSAALHAHSSNLGPFYDPDSGGMPLDSCRLHFVLHNMFETC